MKHNFRYYLLLSGLLLFSACSFRGFDRAGLADISPVSDRVAIIDGHELFIADIRGQNRNQRNKGQPIQTSSGALFNPTASRLLYVDPGEEDEDDRVCTESLDDISISVRNCPVAAPSGLLSAMYLPSGEIAIFSARGSGENESSTLVLQLYTPDASEMIADEIEFDHLFIMGKNNAAADFGGGFLGTRHRLWRLPAGQDLRFVLLQGANLILFESGSELNGPIPLGQLTPEAEEFYASVNALFSFPRSALSPDGTKLATYKLGTEEEESILYLADLAADVVPLVEIATGLCPNPSIAFSPDSSELVYEVQSGEDTCAVWVVNVDSTNPRMLTDNATLIDWR